MFLGADGSVRMFDLRHLEHSTIIYEDSQKLPLLRLAWNKQDPNYLATMAMDAFEVSLIHAGVYIVRKYEHMVCSAIASLVSEYQYSCAEYSYLSTSTLVLSKRVLVPVLLH